MVEMGSLHDASDAQQPHVPIVRVVDDDDKVRRSWQFVLEGEGWQVQAYESAVRFLQEDDPSIPGCIVCDVRMPEMSGIELQTEMKRTGNTMPLVLISAHADLVMAVKAVKDGAYDFLLKPVETERLIQTGTPGFVIHDKKPIMTCRKFRLTAVSRGRKSCAS